MPAGKEKLALLLKRFHVVHIRSMLHIPNIHVAFNERPSNIKSTFIVGDRKVQNRNSQFLAVPTEKFWLDSTRDNKEPRPIWGELEIMYLRANVKSGSENGCYASTYIISACRLPSLKRLGQSSHPTKVPELAVVIMGARDEARTGGVDGEGGDDLRVVFHG